MKKQIHKSIFWKILKISIVSILFIFIAFILFVRSPWGQNLIIGEATNYFSKKTNTEISIDKVYLSFSGNLLVEGLYLEDTKNDTLVFSKKLEASIALLPLIKGNEFHLKSLNWEGLHTHIYRKDTITDFNYTFIVNAFTSNDTTTVSTSESEPLKITLGDFKLNDINITYNDKVTGTDAKLKLIELDIETNEFDIEAMHFEMDEILLSGAQITYNQTKPLVKNPNDPETKLPFVSIEELNINNTAINYISIPDYINAQISLKELLTEIPVLDLNQQKIEVESLDLKSAYVNLELLKPVTKNTPESPGPFEWPKWQIETTDIAIQNATVLAKTGKVISEEGLFNLEDIQLKQFNLSIPKFSYVPKNASLIINNIAFKDRSGFQLIKLATTTQLNSTAIDLKQLQLITNNNSVTGNATIRYNSIDNFITDPSQSLIDISFPQISLNAKDALYFSPELKENHYLNVLSQKDITGNIVLDGELNKLNIPDTKLNWGKNTTALIKGTIENPTDTEKLWLDIQKFKFNTIEKDVANFINPDTLGIDLPEKLALNGNAKGALNDLNGKVELLTPDGKLLFNGEFQNTETITLNGAIDITDIQLDKLLKNEKLGTYSFITTFSAKGANLNTLDAELNTDFEKLEYNNYDFSNLKLNGKLTNGNGDLNLNFKDKNLDFDWENKIQLDSIASKVHSEFVLTGANFKNLGISNNDIRAKLNLVAHTEGNNLDNLKFDTKFTNILAIKKSESFLLGDIMMNGVFTENTTDINIQSNPLVASLTSNTDLTNLITSIKNQLSGYFKEDILATNDSIPNNTKMKLSATIHQAPILEELFLPKLTTLEPVTINLAFNAAQNTLRAKAKSPKIIYNESSLDSLHFKVNSIGKNLSFDFGIKNLAIGAVDLQKIDLKGQMENKILYTNFKAMDGSEVLINLASEIEKKTDTTLFHLQSNDLIINKKNWSIPSSNQVKIADNFINTTNFTLSRNEQKITVSTELKQNIKDHIGFSFQNFNLKTITSLINKEKLVASGILDGNFIIENPFINPGILADATISKLEIMEVSMGKLDLNAESIDTKNYKLDLSVLGENVDLKVEGDYLSDKEAPKFDIDVDLKKLALKTIEKFAETYISDTSGALSAKVSLTGTTSEPKVVGNINFNEAALTLNAYNAKFTLPEEAIKLDNSGIYFNQFSLYDSNKNLLIIDGKINTDELTNPEFNLTIKAKDIEVLNSNKEDNELFYGKLNIDTDISVNGFLELPAVRGNLFINENSDFTYVIPKNQVDLVEKKGVVLFVNKKNPNDILTQKDEEVTPSAVVQGYDIKVKLGVSKKSIFDIIIDERSGDHLKISGGGDLNFGISENGDMSLSGKFQVVSGHYEVSLYNLIKKRFEIEKGSSIIWGGNPLEADMDIRAIYNVEASASGLMSSQLSSESTEVSSQYQQKLPFLVYLNIDGELLQPEISFNLDMPEDSQGELDGQVYTQVQLLNTQEEDLNKQVFSLLVLNQFYPTSSSDGSSGGSVSIARDNVNNVLSEQLNKYSNKVFGKSGVDVNFGLNSYTDYEEDTPVDKTELDVSASKKLLNDRLIVEVGSGLDIEENSENAGQTTPLVGTVNIQYLFDQKGRWRIKGYRKNDFENVIEGQVILTGISLIFSKEFNKFKALFKKSMREKMREREKEKEKEE